MQKRNQSHLAKLQPPRLHRPVLRERLFALLDERSEHAAVWVSGPPGAGKSTLLASYLDERSRPTLWFQVDADDSDPPTFTYFLSTAAAPHRATRRSLPVLTPEHLGDVRAFARKYFQQLFAKLHDGCAVVFDNMHELDDHTPVWQLIDEAIGTIPQGFCAYFISRMRPPAVLAAQQARQTLTEIAWQDLRFTDEEAGRFVRGRAVLDQRALTSLIGRADGWIAGLVLMIGQPHGVGQSPHATEESRQRVFDYFAGDRFDLMRPEQRDSLMRLSWLSEITSDLAAEVCGSEAAIDLLEELYGLQMFTDRRVGRETSYRFHDLFREFLQHRCRQHFTPQQCAGIWRQVAKALERKQLFEPAIQRYLDAGEFGAAAELILKCAPSLLGHGRIEPLRANIRALPEAVVDAQPWLRYWLGIALLHADLAAATQVLTRAHNGFVSTRDRLGRALSAAALINVVYFEYDQFERMAPWLAELDELDRAGLRLDAPSDEIAVLGAIIQAALFQAPAHPRLLPAVRRMRTLLSAPVDVNHRISAAIPLLIYANLIADLPLGDWLLDNVADLVSDSRLTPLNQAYWWLFVGYHMHVRGDSPKAFAAFDRSDAIAADFGLTQTQVLSPTLRSYELQASGDVATSFAVLREVEGRVDLDRNMDSAQYHLSGTLLNLVTMDGPAAARHARLGMEAANRVGSPFFRSHWMWFCAGGLAINDEWDEASAWLDTCWEESVGTYCERHLSGILCIRAYIALRRGEPDEVARYIVAMLEHAKRDDTSTFIRMTLGIKDPVLRFAFERRIDRPYVVELIQRLRVPPGPGAGEDWPFALHIYALGGFRVVRLGQPLQVGRREPRKPLQLLRAIIALGGERVQLSTLQDALWPDQDGDAAKAACDVALHRLRKLLGSADLIRQGGGTVSIDRSLVWVDAWALLEASSETSRRARDPRLAGEFLPDDSDAPWSAAMRERVRRKQSDLGLRQGKA